MNFVLSQKLFSDPLTIQRMKNAAIVISASQWPLVLRVLLKFTLRCG